MGHIGKEFCFRTISIFCGPVSLFQCLTGFNLLSSPVSHPWMPAILLPVFHPPIPGYVRGDLISLFHPGCSTQTYKYHFHFSVFPNIIRGYQDIYSFQWFQSLIFFKNLHLKIMIKSQRFIYHLSIQIVEFISVIFQITDNKTVTRRTILWISSSMEALLPSADAVHSPPLSL